LIDAKNLYNETYNELLGIEKAFINNVKRDENYISNTLTSIENIKNIVLNEQLVNDYNTNIFKRMQFTFEEYKKRKL
jgi:uncharacterized protein YvpB